MMIFITNIDYQVTQNDIRFQFEQFGTVKTCLLCTDRETGESRGFGFVCMPGPEALIAIESLNNAVIGRRRVVVRKSHPRRQSGAET